MNPYCINNEGIEEHLTSGRKYAIVEYDDDDFVVVIDDLGKLFATCIDRFKGMGAIV